MDKLISRETLLKEIASVCSSTQFGKSTAKMLVKKAPAVDAAPVVHGRWIAPTELDGHTVAECSRCHKIRAMDDFCSSCGARMDLPEGEEN